ncbi:MAG: hypothetical protein V4760_03385 [Bdellovibrionota bacterium]
MKTLTALGLALGTVMPRTALAAPDCSALFTLDKSALVQEWLQSTEKFDRNPLLMKVFDFQERLLLSKLDPIQLKNDAYRENLVRKLVDVEIRRGLSPLGDYEFSVGSREATELRRLAMRSLLEKGLNGWIASYRPTPTHLARVKRVANLIRWNPAFQVFLEWRLPIKNVKLTETQVEKVLLGGLDAIEGDPQLASLKQSAKLRDNVRATNEGLRRMVFAGLVAYLYLNFTLESSEKEELVSSETETGPIVSVIGDLEQTTTIDTDGALLVLANAEVSTMIAELKERTGKSPSVKELEAMKSHVCVQKYGASLGQAGTARCLSK